MNDTQALWGDCLRRLREGGKHLTHAAVSQVDDVEFTPNQIILHITDPALHQVITNHIHELHTILGADKVVVNLNKTKKANLEKISALQSLLGEKLSVLD